MKTIKFGKRTIKLKSKAQDKLNINIESQSDIDDKTYMCWGDHWVKERMILALEDQGFNVGVEPKDADVTVYLWGSPYAQKPTWPYHYNPKSYNVLWLYSHPDNITQRELNRYNMVFCLSPTFLPRLQHPNVHPKALIGCTDFTPIKSPVKPCDVVFVGNTRGKQSIGRTAVQWLRGQNWDVKVYGANWNNPKFSWMHKWLAGTYWEYDKLHMLYNSARITLVDGHNDMHKHGFVPVKIFDTLASGGFVISQFNTGMQYVFGSTVPMYRDQAEMIKLIKHYLNNPKERLKLANQGKEMAQSHTYPKRMEEMMSAVIKKRSK